MFFERELYPELVECIKYHNVALFLDGPRQVGKTTLLLKLGKEHFKNCIHIDLKTKWERFEGLMNYHEEKFGAAVSPEETGPIWEAVLKDMNPKYTNTPDTLVVLDEIQESPRIYNNIRNFRRGLKSRLAVSGSYLGIICHSDEYWDSTGDVFQWELSSLTYTEFLKAVGVWDKYSEINTFDLSQMTDDERETCEQVRELYRVYSQIGGYPEVVRSWIEVGNIDVCKRIVATLLRRLYHESSRYFGPPISDYLWELTLRRVTEDIVTKTGDLDIRIAKEDFRDEDTEGLQIRRRDKINALKWLINCAIIGAVPIYNMLNKVCTYGNRHLFYLRDMGILAQLSIDLVNVLPSDISGMMAENFAYLQLRTMKGKEFIESSVHSFNGTWGQIDFIMHNQERKRFGIEVKHGSGSTKSGDKALAEGKVDYLIRVQDTYGSISEKQATIPIFMMDKLGLIVSGADSEKKI